MVSREMNMFVPQNPKGTAEMMLLSSARFRIMSAQKNAPCIGLVQDAPLGIYILTSNDTFVTKETFFNVIMNLIEFPDLEDFYARIKKHYPKYIKNGRLAKKFPGKILYSVVLPKNLKYHKKIDERPDVEIIDGIITSKSGPLCKKVVGATAMSLVHVLYKEYNQDVCADFLSNSEFLINNWLCLYGFSVGTSDCYINNHKDVEENMEKVKVEYKEKLNIGGDFLEEDLSMILNSASNVGHKLTKDGMRKGEKNSIVIMYKSGAKGNHTNCTQITAHLGQQNVRGQRPAKNMSNFTRCLPIFSKEDLTPESQGFINYSFLDGLRPADNFFHAMSGREGLIDTAIKTAESGYIQRKFGKKLEDAKVHFDGTVRYSNGAIVQFLYGNDGYDASKLYYVDGQLFFIDVVRLADRLNNDVPNEKNVKLSEKAIEKICGDIKTNYVETSAVHEQTRKTREFLAEQLRKIKIAPSMLNKLRDIIMRQYNDSLAQAGDNVGAIASSSLGEITTQSTLNSVVYDTDILIRNEKGYIEKVKIGEFFDKYNSKDALYYSDSDTTYAELEEYYEVPTCDEKGETSWQRIEAVTRHPVKNDDGTDTILRVKTRFNQTIEATKGESFLKLIDGKITPVRGDSLKVGDYLPVSLSPIKFTETKKLNMRKFFDPKTHLYVSEIKKAIPVMYEKYWWKTYNKKTFELPYNRSDSFKNAYQKGKFEQLKDGCFYLFPYGTAVSQIPEDITLDYDFGYLLGAYCADGCITERQISISKLDKKFFEPIERICKKFNITTKIYSHENAQGVEGWTAQDIRIYSVLLTKILEKLGGRFSDKKFIAPEIIFSNKECLKGFLDGYIGGDGTIYEKEIVITSVSYQLLLDTTQILNIFGIYSRITKPTKIESNNMGSKNIKQHYTLFISNKQAKNLAGLLNLKIKHKQDAIEKLKTRKCMYDVSIAYRHVPNEIDGKLIDEKRNGRFENIIFEKITSIEEIDNPTNYMYDLTVEKTRNFQLYNRVLIRDSFHQAGLQKDETSGNKRLTEILDATKKPKTPSCLIAIDEKFLKDDRKYNLEKTQSLFKFVQFTTVGFFAEKITLQRIDEHDPQGSPVDILPQESYVHEWWEDEHTYDFEKQDWVIEIKFDITKLFKFNYTLQDLAKRIKKCDFACLDCAVSPNILGTIKIYIDFEKNYYNKSLVPIANIITEDNINYFYTRDVIIKKLKLLKIGGIKNIKKVYTKEDKRTKKWYIDTQGANFLDVMCLSFCDYAKTTCDDFWQVFKTLGIRAVRKCLINEFKKVFNFESSYINPRHIELLVDSMVHTGTITSVRREGIDRSNGPLAKCAFEKTLDNFAIASMFCERENIEKNSSLSANIVIGRQFNSGTGFMDILPNKKMEKENKKVQIIEYKKERPEESLKYKRSQKIKKVKQEIADLY